MILETERSKSPVLSAKKESPYKDVESKLHSPTKAALGKYGSRNSINERP